MGRTLSALALLAAIHGCSAITSYDYEFVDGGIDAAPTDTGAMDAAPDAAPDGSVDAPDSSDGGGSECPEPCFADLPRDVTNGGILPAGRASWSLLADTRDALGVTYEALMWNTDQWEGRTVVLRRCGKGECADPDAFYLAGSAADPTVEMVATDRGVYRVGGTYQALSVGTQELLISRDGRHDALFEIEATSADGLASFTELLTLEAGDRVRFTVRPRGGSSVEGALRVWVAEPAVMSPADTCEVAVDFDTGMFVWPDTCGGSTPTLDFTGGTRSSESIASLTGLGSALLLSDGVSFVRLTDSSRMPLGTDFTIQLWARFDSLSGTPGNFKVLFSNVGGAETDPGVFLDYNPGASIGFGGYDPAESLLVTSYVPVVDDWHFYRLVREGAEMRLCIDGAPVGMVPISASSDFTATREMLLGRQPGPGVFFAGALDEFRVYREALPCVVE